MEQLTSDVQKAHQNITVVVYRGPNPPHTVRFRSGFGVIPIPLLTTPTFPLGSAGTAKMLCFLTPAFFLLAPF